MDQSAIRHRAHHASAHRIAGGRRRIYMQAHDTDEDGLPIIQPEAAGTQGLPPVLRRFSNKQQENEFIIRCLQKWNAAGKSWRDIGVVYRSKSTGLRLAKALGSAGIPYLLTHDKASKANYSIDVSSDVKLTHPSDLKLTHLG
ncbi:MAG: hypothetical protein HPY82_15405 [Gammaproteobacteria bacterium]|nr:hypothetical protein [Gammaproteobacteria bacterium]